MRWSYLGLENIILLNSKKSKELLETLSKSQYMQTCGNYKIKNIKVNYEKYIKHLKLDNLPKYEVEDINLMKILKKQLCKVGHFSRNMHIIIIKFYHS